LVIDSSIIIAAFRKQEAKHQLALEIIINSKQIVVLDYVLSEVATVLKLRESWNIASKCLEFLINNKDIAQARITNSLLKRVIDYYQKNQNQLSFVDTAILLYTKEQQATLATFDQDLAQEFKRLKSN
jgi:predicted nucleic acid-binding protein